METPTLTFNTGGVRYLMKNEYGEEMGVLRFNPTDVNLIGGVDELQKYFATLDVNADTSIAELVKINSDIKKRFDELLMPGAADEIFKYCSPLSVNDSTYFYVQVLEAIISIIEEVTKKRLQINKKIDSAVNDILGE